MFCGREREVREILANSRAGRLVVITARPGLGLTTFLSEGVAPALRAEGFIVAVLGEWQGRFMVTEMKETIAAAVREQADDSFFAQTESIAEMLLRIRTRTGRHMALLLDQFEDYLRCHARTFLSDSFDAELSLAVMDSGAQFVIGLQEHAVTELRRLEQFVPNLLRFEMSLRPLDATEAREALIQAGEERSIGFEPAAVETLLTAPITRFEDGVHPFYLMAGVERLLAAGGEKKWTTATAAMIEIYGGADRLILESLDPVLSQLTPTQTDLLFRWFPLLLSDIDQRLAVTAEGLQEYAGKLNRFALGLIPVLLEMGILRSIEIGDTTRYEIARDSLAPILRDWWRRREAMLIARRRARFRVRSLSLAVGAIGVLYLIWLGMQIWK